MHLMHTKKLIMFITDLSIKRPVVSAVFSLILIVFGLFVFWKLPVRELPSGLQPPVVQVQVDYQSASAPIVDQEITQIIEDVIGGVEGIKNIDSTSENGRSTIKVEFDTSVELDAAANDVRENVARIVDALPEEAKVIASLLSPLNCIFSVFNVLVIITYSPMLLFVLLIL